MKNISPVELKKVDCWDLIISRPAKWCPPLLALFNLKLARSFLNGSGGQQPAFSTDKVDSFSSISWVLAALFLACRYSYEEDGIVISTVLSKINVTPISWWVFEKLPNYQWAIFLIIWYFIKWQSLWCTWPVLGCLSLAWSDMCSALRTGGDWSQ